MKGKGGRGKVEEVASGQWPAVHGDRPFFHHSPNPKYTTPTLSIVFLGDAGRTEFCEARADLDCWGAVYEFAKVDSALVALCEEKVIPDLIVIAQTFPGQFSHQAVDQLRQLAPLARILGLMGSWCEGEMRTGTPWPAVVRTYWHRWIARSNQQFHPWAQGKRCSWALPSTVTEEERFLEDVSNNKRDDLRHRSAGLIVISARQQQMGQWLSTTFRRSGYATLWQRSAMTSRVEGARAAIFDGTDLGHEESEELQRLAKTLRPAPVIALMTFPRIEDLPRARSAGAASVVSKPLHIDDLLWELEKVCNGE